MARPENKVIIAEPMLAPYFIKAQNTVGGGFMVYRTIPKERTKDNIAKEKYVTSSGSLIGAVQIIIKKLSANKFAVVTLAGYIGEYKKTAKELMSSLHIEYDADRLAKQEKRIVSLEHKLIELNDRFNENR
jgi:hypothetical protein